jgi:CheY-like chemotaxis protein
MVDIKGLSILYVDDNPADIDNFRVKANRFNLERDNEDSLRLELITCETPGEAVSFFDEQAFDVVICDYNMPEETGLKLILQYFKNARPGLCYVIYTAVGNLTDEIRRVCNNEDILLFVKSETFSTLIGQIINKRFFPEKQDTPIEMPPTEQLYYFLAEELIASLKNIQRFDPDFEIYAGTRVYKPEEMIRELQKRTLTGFDYIRSYIEGLKFFNRQP